jgi:hypothetical protein
MPEISRFFGISIKMFFGDHVPPHFHAEYGEFKAQINIKSRVIIAGALPPRFGNGCRMGITPPDRIARIVGISI